MPANERAKALGWLSAATSLGVIVGPALGSLSARAGGSAPGLVAAALCVINAVFAWRWLPESRVLQPHVTTESGRHLPPPQPRPVRDAMWEVIRHPRRPVAQLIWVYAVAMLAYNSTPPVFALYLSWRFGITERNIGYFFLIFGGVGVLMRAFVVGPINDRFGEVRTMRWGAVLYGLGYALIPLAASVPAFLLYQTQQALRGVASVLGPIWAGFAYQALGPRVPFFACAGVIACALLLAMRVPRGEAAAAPAAA